MNKWFCTLLLVVLTSGCGSESNDVNPSTISPIGIWIANCYDAGGGVFITESREYADSITLNVTVDEYDNSSCTGEPAVSTITKATYNIANTVTSTSGKTVTEIDITITEQDGVTIPPASQEAFYSIIFIDDTGNNLFVGIEDATFDGSTPSLRPLTLDTLAFVKKAPGNLVVGGGFENPLIPSGNLYLLNATPAGWSGEGDITSQGYAGAVSSGDGNQWFDLDGGTGAGTGISQDIALSAATTYEFSFVYNGGGGGSTTQVSYTLASNSEALLSGSVSTAALDVYAGSPWSTFSILFTPSFDGVATLNIMSNGTYSGGFIDAVDISVAQ